MSKLKYLNICAGAMGITAVLLGGTIVFKGLTSGASARSVLAGTCLLLGGSCFAVKSLYEIQIESEIDKILIERRNAIPTNCRGCRNFHGIEYEGVMLVCAIHPTGIEEKTCPDWKSFRPRSKS
ncbi:hypothetical protein GNF10_27905 [Nostoc sp. UCD121]|uniref:hypothetical protein n=1 Tax=unclassified Nostoc TaxID=2593658 RepID=UPI0016289820|nr:MULTISPECIES: hypothetical protein [unclassified Nostoc]MBC1218767.1 hypothetical protein [Nostoc sp. UCD120]MBC1279679.1 hypothetical protein [Nostoc sp. UCD121]MBC1299564.1 hypothetical protein [Nostoc sp. UCD122]